MRTPTLVPITKSQSIIGSYYILDRHVLVITSFQDIPALGLSPQSNPQSQTNRRPAESPRAAPLAPATQRTQGRRKGVLGSAPRPTAPDGRSDGAVTRRAPPASPARPENGPFSRRTADSPGERRILPEIGAFSQRTGHSPRDSGRPAEPGGSRHHHFTAYCCSALHRTRRTRGVRRALRARSVEQ